MVSLEVQSRARHSAFERAICQFYLCAHLAERWENMRRYNGWSGAT